MGRIVITGSTRGIGLALAERFLDSGWSVVINGRSEASVSAALSKLSSSRPDADCRGKAGSAESEEAMNALWNLAAEAGPVDVWINNAGVDQSRSRVWELPAEEISSLTNTNIVGSFIGSKTAAKGMLSQDRGIIYQMEGFGSNGMTQPGLAAYGASKTAVSYLAKALRTELKSIGSKVRSGSISPGMVMTDLLKAGLPDDTAERRQVLRVFDILADSPEVVSTYICNKIRHRRPEKISWLTGTKAAWRFATAFTRRGRFSKMID